MSQQYRTIPADRVLDGLSARRQRRIARRAAQLIAEEVGLVEDRKLSSGRTPARQKARARRVSGR